MFAALSSHLPFIFDQHRLHILYGCDCPTNTVYCLTLQILLTVTYNLRFLTNPTEKYARQWSSLPPACCSTGSHICQLDLLGITDYIVFVNKICNICARLLYYPIFLAYKITIKVKLVTVCTARSSVLPVLGNW